MRKTVATKLFLHGVLLAGAVAFIATVAHLSVPEPVKFFSYCALALIAASLKVRLPGITGTLTVNYVFVLIGLADLSLPECMIAATLATIVQCLVHAKNRPGVVQVLFNVASIAIAVVACGAVFSSPYLLSHGIGLLMRLTFASIAYFVLNTFAVTAIISLTESKSFARVWRECYLWVFPFFVMGAVLAWGFHQMAARFGWQAAMLGLPGIYMIYAAYHFYLGRLQDEKEHAQDIAALHLRTIEALALAIDAKDQTSHDHLQRVHVYATEIAREMNLSDLEMEALQAAAMLHDIGKLAVPEHIVSKPGKLTPEEFEKMKIHPVVGAEILERVQFPYPVAAIVRSHHEKWDGTGYPDGLRGEAIPVGARILSVVDCLDAIAADRQYRKAVPLDQAMAIVAEQAGKAFDPKIVDILKRRYLELERMAVKQPVQVVGLSTNQPVSRGERSGAGFEETGSDASVRDKLGFLTSIAAARQEVQTLFELSDDLGQSLRQSNTLAIFADKVKIMIPHDLLCIYTKREDILEPDYVTGSEQRLFSSLRIPVGQGLSGWVAENNSSVVNGNPAVEPGYLNDTTVITNLKSALAIPLEEDGSAIGVLSLYSREKNAFSRDHLRILQALGPRLGAVLSNGRKLSEAQDNAVTDYLTGLPNSRSLYIHLDTEMARCRRRAACLGVFLCDLDGFKRINDEHGHIEGNVVLKAVAAALKECCRGYDYVARMGGDEFVVLAPDVERSALEENVQRFREAVELTGLRLGYKDLSSSIGAVVFVPSEGDVDADALLAEADRRMYANKRRRAALTSGGSEPVRFCTRGPEKPDQGSLDLLLIDPNAVAAAEEAASVSVH
jgi:diguanylate cyclase (GGDEF)-like protein/putative nucleotidyltransferase with HDIG domain